MMTREEIIRLATEAITVRNDREDTFPLIADLWTGYLGYRVTPADVCRMMALLKIARSKMGVSNADSCADCAGYMACCAEYEDVGT